MSDCMECPASMCPLIAPDGSPWTGTYAAPCPGHDDIDTGGCEDARFSGNIFAAVAIAKLASGLRSSINPPGEEE